MVEAGRSCRWRKRCPLPGTDEGQEEETGLGVNLRQPWSRGAECLLVSLTDCLPGRAQLLQDVYRGLVTEKAAKELNARLEKEREAKIVKFPAKAAA